MERCDWPIVRSAVFGRILTSGIDLAHKTNPRCRVVFFVIMESSIPCLIGGSTSSFPLKTVKGSGEINGAHTDVVATEFSNMLLVVVTQLEKIGTMMTVKKEEIQGDIVPVYHITTIFGKDEPELHVAARYLDEKLNVSKPLLLSLCLKALPDHSTTEAIVELLKEIYSRIKS